MTLVLNATNEGVLLDVQVAPRASKERVLGVHDGAVKIALTAAPVDGEANAALTAFLAKRLHIAKGAVRIVRGHTAKRKTLELLGVTADTVRDCLEATHPEPRSNRD
jgi:uncharacterized protein (TIGR00251 family)